MADQPDPTVQSEVPGGTREENRDVSIDTEVKPRAVADDRKPNKRSRGKRSNRSEGINPDATATRPPSEPNPPGTPPDRNSL